VAIAALADVAAGRWRLGPLVRRTITEAAR
jgi:hypothetical protein